MKTIAVFTLNFIRGKGCLYKACHLYDTNFFKLPPEKQKGKKMKKTIITTIIAVVMALFCGATAFAADVAPATEVEATTGFCMNHSAKLDGSFCLNHSKDLATNIASAIWTDEYAVYTTDDSGVVMVYFTKAEYVCARCHPEVVDEDNTIGSAIWMSPIGAITASGDGIQRIFLNDGYVCAECFIRESIGPAIWCDQYATYTADGSGVVKVYFDKEYICGVCNPEIVDTNDGIGSAIWMSPIGAITASGDGIQRVYLNDGYICAACAE